ncbi:MAG: SDR family oxidoreductase [Candidatus Thermoplasmatota archaeon]|nr:SDR family oxidoreductase [Candidatus Thermoplasmatota archaeon]
MVKISDLREKKILITGGSSGIGKATAEMMSSKGASVIITARDESKLKRTLKDVKGVVSSYSVDISNWEEVQYLANRIMEEHGKLDIVINSAGIVHPGTLDSLTIDQIESILNIDLLGTINVCKAFQEGLISPGYIINISSVAGFMGIYGYTVYSAAKFGVWGFSQALRMELEPKGIGVGVVFPPDTKTPGLDLENRTKPKELKELSGTIKPISPEKVASSIVRGIKKGDFMIFPDGASRSTYHANRLVGPAVRSWMDTKVSSSRKE